ncbi:MAG: N-acetylmuramoyl-L-alanine amidase [Chloroflexi bacterium]|nr:N-acetylmuramoyl-L-alanine amidase [Chloroflexota bacterium]
MRIRRRTLLKTLACSIGALAASPFLAPVLAETVPRSGRFRLAGLIGSLQASFPQNGLERTWGDGLTLAADAAVGVLLSPPLEAAFPFNAVGARWQLAGDPARDLLLEIRTAAADGDWSDWTACPALDHAPAGFDRSAGELLLIEGDRLQFRVTLLGDTTSPLLTDLEIVYIDSTAGPSLASLEAGAWLLAAGRPAIISRRGWGCPQPNSSDNWPPVYQPAQKLIVHHTVTANGTDPLRLVRAIWQYHAVDLGWGDIGYNFLVDQFGNIYEGRYGGDDVVAGHALQYNYGSAGAAVLGQFQPGDPNAPPAGQPTSQAIDGLVTLLAWKCNQRAIDPSGRGLFLDKDLPNVCGHRDALSTSCPGSSLYVRLPDVRTRVKALYDPQAQVSKYACQWGTHSTPSQIGPGETVSVQITVQNLGWFAWPQAGPNPVHLGYRWYRSDGSQYVQSADGDRRSALPIDAVAYNQTVTINAQLTAPAALGTYTLKWDLVHEGYTWFADAGTGSRTLDAAVTVAPPALSLGQSQILLVTRPGGDSGWVPLAIGNAGPGTFTFSVSVASAGWLQVSPLSGGPPGSVRVWAKAAGLRIGTYEGQVNVSASGTSAVLNSPQSVRVTLVVTDRFQRRGFLPSIVAKHPD